MTLKGSMIVYPDRGKGFPMLRRDRPPFQERQRENKRAPAICSIGRQVWFEMGKGGGRAVPWSGTVSRGAGRWVREVGNE